MSSGIGESKEKEIRTLFLDIMGEEYKITEPIEKLGGMNNNNYRVVTNLKDLVLRLPGEGSNESVNRESEMSNSKIAYELGLDCTIVYFNEETGLKIAEYIEDAETLSIETAKEEENMELMSYALKILHNSGKSFFKDFDPFEEIEDYKKTIIKNDESILKDFKDLDSIVDFLNSEVKKMGIKYVPCHLDAWPENFVKNKEKIYLIDWEYSSNYDGLWDVVSIGLECEYSKDEQELFFNKYFERKPLESEILKMNILRILMDVYWSMWAIAKVSCGGDDLYDYSIGRYKRGVDNLNKLDK